MGLDVGEWLAEDTVNAGWGLASSAVANFGVLREWNFWFATSMCLVHWGVIRTGLHGARRR